MKRYQPFLIARFFCTTRLSQNTPENNTLAWSKPISTKFCDTVGEKKYGYGYFVMCLILSKRFRIDWAPDNHTLELNPIWAKKA